MRRIQVIGNLTKDAEVKNIKGDDAISFSVAANDYHKDSQGNKIEKVYYYDCTIWKKDVRVANYLLKGTKIYVEGTPEVNVYQDKDGNNRGGVRIRVNYFEILTPQSQNKQNEDRNERDGNSFQHNENWIPEP